MPIAALSTVRAGMTVADIYNVKPDLSAFRARGGKLIIYHGWADEQVTPFASLDFYPQIVAQAGPVRHRRLPAHVHDAGHRSLLGRAGRGQYRRRHAGAEPRSAA